MASTKKANSTNNASNDTGSGFRTATFGFDKNDVTLYIASLRKKMKAIEDEYEQKLTQLQEDSVSYSDDLKREYAVKLADKEKQWKDEILEHTTTINNQQEQINNQQEQISNQQDQIKKQQDQIKNQQNKISELEKQLSEKNKSVDSLKAQLTAASANNSKVSSAASTKAEEAYKQFTTELRSISESAQKTLASIEKLWNGESKPAQPAAADTKPAQPAAPAAKSEQSAAPAAKPAQPAASDTKPAQPAASDTKPAQPAASDTKPAQPVAPAAKSEQPAAPAPKPAQPAAPDTKPAQPAAPDIKPEQPAAPAPKPVQPAVPDSKPAQPAAPAAKPEQPAAKLIQTAASKPVNQPIEISSGDADFSSLLADEKEDSFVDLIADRNDVNMNVKSAPAPKPVKLKAEISDEFASLLADSDDDSAIAGTGSFGSAAFGDGDFKTDLLSDMVIASEKEHRGGDLGKMLKEKEEKEFDAFKDLFVSDSTSNRAFDGFSELFVTPIEESKPGISSEFDLKPYDNSDVNGSGDFLLQVDSPANKTKAEPAFVEKNKEDDLFDFSFLVADDDEEDDMSSDAFDFR